MKKYLNRIALGAGTVGIIIAGAAAFSAFEAHVINVTAKIENALSVNPESINFGTVFPQEQLYEPLSIAMSASFLEENRVDDINYVIKQKAKPKHPEDPVPVGFDSWHEYCAASILDLNNCYPLLCPYLSKTPDGSPPNDTGISAFHDPQQVASGRLSKLEQDEVDNWTIDLDVPCFDGQCAQDWTHQGYELPQILEHETLGCDLWIEVTGISEAPKVTVTEGSPRMDKGFGARYKSFGNTGSREHYLGVGDLGVGGNRVEKDYTWTAGSHTVSFSYDKSNDKLVSVIDGTNTLEYPNFASNLASKTTCSLSNAKVMQVAVAARHVDTQVDLNNVDLSGNSLGNFHAQYNQFNNWTVSGFDFNQNFTLTGDLVLTGSFPSSSGDELSKVELLVGCPTP